MKNRTINQIGLLGFAIAFISFFILESCGKTSPTDSHISNRLQKEKYQ